MSGVLALRLAGPLQSWGASSRFTRRTTESAPTKSGVIGLLAAAAGVERGDDRALAPLAALRFGVRIDQPGTRIRDFHTAHHAVTGKSMPLSERYYLADAVFVAAVEGEHTLLAELHAALKSPVYLPFLGRRSCPPAEPVELGLFDDARLEHVLRDVPWQASVWYRRRHRSRPPGTLPVLVEAAAGDEHGGADTLRDQPLSFAAAHRRHALRTVVTATVPMPHAPVGVPRHDPFDALEDESS
ncbi:MULTISPECIES: type I-E CRISPR-associated protein Cas5/CasD [Streptomyces]|uniref:Type I-E CRISPR-associated protein Cas5/CasD n=1 Tax=Streptomyces sp. 900129855 TaxID=3155129 RepID=A0ABV2ZL99_9ACTN